VFTLADILEGKTGAVVVAVPERLPPHRALELRLRDGGFDMMADGEQVGKIDKVAPPTLALLAEKREVKVLECLLNERLPAHITLTAKVVDDRKPSKGTKR
jgi:hypothetical protein